MQTQQRCWKCFQQYHVVNGVVSSCIVVALVLYFGDVVARVKVMDAHPQPNTLWGRLSVCAHPVSLESVASKELSVLATHTLNNVIAGHGTLMEASNRIRQSSANLNLPYTSSQRCISEDASQSDQNEDIAYKPLVGASVPAVSSMPDGSDVSAPQAAPAIHFNPQVSTTPFKPLQFASQSFLDATQISVMPLTASMWQGSAGNVFPFGQCTWWANQRYHQLSGSFVPWRINANAFQWVDRAYDYGWYVSGTPIPGSIIVLQPYVDGAYGFGHVGVVEKLLPGGSVIASSMNWGSHPGMITKSVFAPGPGVSFISPASV